MIQKIKKSRFSKVVASYLALQLLMTTIQPSSLFALTGGPAQPEFNSFTPIGTSDMVNLSSGNFNYNIPIMDVGGYPLNLAYDSGVTMDQEASWVGLGWNLNVGQINRQMRGIPDDFNGDKMKYENDSRTNITVGSNFELTGNLFGLPEFASLGVGLGIQYNNYEGITFKPSFGPSFDLGIINAGFEISGSTTGGATVSPSLGLNLAIGSTKNDDRSLTAGVGLSFNSRKGLETLSLSSSAKNREGQGIFSISGSVPFNNNHVYTPIKRAGTISGNFSFSGALGSEVLGAELQGQITGYASYQAIRKDEKSKYIPAYGYNYHEFANPANSVLDFNREKDRAFSNNTTVLPISNHTYDIYSINGQGLSGAFRPHRSQVSYLSDNIIKDIGDGGSAGGEFGVGWNVHGGFNTKISPSLGYTSGWLSGNFALSRFSESQYDTNSPLYEPTYFKMAGELDVDPEVALYQHEAHGNSAMKLAIGGSKYNRTLQPTYEVKTYNNSGVPVYESENISSKIKRSERDRRNTSIHKVTQGEAAFDPLVTSRDMPAHHIAGFKALKPDGSTYVYGETAYNWEKKEITVDVSGVSQPVDYENGVISNNGNVVSTTGSDKYKNIITTPAYAHTYLLSSVLSVDYEDLSGDGPTIDDLGSYTLFNYGKEGDDEYYLPEYNWKTPYGDNQANFNEGLKSRDNDQKGNIIRGNKELRYIRTIETKTHVAYFRLSKREDAKEADGSDHMSKLDKIFLYSKPEYDALVSYIEEEEGQTIDDFDDISKLSESAIKVAHFDYSYELGSGIPNSNPGGRLTLDQVYFTYRGSNMGRYTPYSFNYDGFNPEYSLKGYDVWGNYKSNEGVNGSVLNSPLTTSEFPFVEQDKVTADKNTSAWLLTSIDLPSGGRLEIETESDDYQYVQGLKAMRMFKIKGFGGIDPLNSSINLYTGIDHTRYVHVKIKDEPVSDDYTVSDFEQEYLSENIDKPIYFRALLNMVNNTLRKYDYVSGYFEIDRQREININTDEDGTYAAIPMRTVDLEGGLSGNRQVNPIAKAGWYFGRSYLNRTVYSAGGDSFNDDFVSIVGDLVSSIRSIVEIFSGPNAALEQKQCARKVLPEKSWVRLEVPNGRKYGGGVRVSEIRLHDNWGGMDTDTNNDSDQRYFQFYGQQYNYDLENGTSSGVATYEPNGSKENPIVEPFYDNNERLVAPKESNYTEKPFGESFFPAPTVTYSRVEVKNLARIDPENNRVVGKHATGRVVTSFYTSKDFPTLTDYTDLIPLIDTPTDLGSFINLSVRNHLSLSQGFVVETNDMNGRMKSQNVFGEGQDGFISGVDYFYNIDQDGNLSSKVPTIDKNGQLTSNDIGMTYDVYNDFRENYSQSKVTGFDYNVAGFVLFIIPIVAPVPVPESAFHETRLRIATTTKVVKRSAIMTKKVARDLGSSVSTKYLAWDAITGQALLTETINEYDDNYYNFTYPSHWYYEGMDRASINLGATGFLQKSASDDYYEFLGDNPNLKEGDELFSINFINILDEPIRKLWVIDAGEDDGKIQLMERRGISIAEDCRVSNAPEIISFKIVRSGHRNQQSASMASVTTQINPLDVNNTGEVVNDIDENTFVYDPENSAIDPRVINASAVMYSEAWRQQWESNLPHLPKLVEIQLDRISYDPTQPLEGNGLEATEYGFNPYLYNVRGEWRAERSYAYLSGRQSVGDTELASPRYQGYFSKFNPFYTRLDADGAVDNRWHINATDWTFASEVTQYTPYGAELENKDALGRFSSAQYGYNYTLPVAVASNSSYEQMGFDGFEDYTYQSDDELEDPHFGFHTPGSEITSITDNTSHTGRHSLKITDEIALVRSYDDSFYFKEAPDCEDPNTNVACARRIRVDLCEQFESNIPNVLTPPENTYFTHITDYNITFEDSDILDNPHLADIDDISACISIAGNQILVNPVTPLCNTDVLGLFRHRILIHTLHIVNNGEGFEVVKCVKFVNYELSEDSNCND